MSAESDRSAFDGRALVHAWVAAVAKPLGFRKRRNSWLLERPETVLVINVQKSSWGGEIYYVNLAIWVKAFGDVKDPVEHRCHVRRRLCAFGTHDECRRSEELLDFENAGPPLEARGSAIREALTQRGLPFLLGLTTFDDLRTAWAEGRLSGTLVLMRLQELLSRRHS
jgi:hypothetical protein